MGCAIESVQRQRDARCRLIVVDDGSTDSSWDVIRSYDVECYCVPNNGAVRAACMAMDLCHTPFIMFLDADDELAPDSLATIIPHLRPEIAKLQFELLPIDEAGKILGKPVPRLATYRDATALKRRVLRTGVYKSPPTSGNVFRRDVCDLLGEVDYECSVDGVTLFAAPFFGDIVSLSRPLAHYRLHGRNLSQSGSVPTAHRFRSEADRFVDRHAHLARILARRGVAASLPDASRMFFYRERRLYQRILEDQAPCKREILALQAQAMRGGDGAAHRIAAVLFLTLCLLLPRCLLRPALVQRFRLGRRSPRALLLHAAMRLGAGRFGKGGAQVG